MKPNIFIGSSKSSEDISKKVKEYLSCFANCHIWSDNFFDVNVSNFDNLCKKIISFDFAIFIGGKDDLSVVKKKVFHTIRDNVIFEYGLFTGALGRQRTFFLMEEGVKTLTDLDGITLLFFSSEETLKMRCEELISCMEEEENAARVSLLPSTATAIAYYYNFVYPVCCDLAEDNSAELEDGFITYKSAALNIILPSELEADLNRRARLYYSDHGYSQCSIALSPPRKRQVFIEPVVDDILEIYDMPTILNSSYHTVNMFIGKDYIGQKTDVNNYLHKEIRNFKRTMELLINQATVTKLFARIVNE